MTAPNDRASKNANIVRVTDLRAEYDAFDRLSPALQRELNEAKVRISAIEIELWLPRLGEARMIEMIRRAR